MQHAYLDSEFTSLNRHQAKLISLALVVPGGPEFYVELTDSWSPADCSPFVLETVLPQLDHAQHGRTTEQARTELLAFLQALGPVEIITDAPTHDWPLLLWLAGPAGLPANVRPEPDAPRIDWAAGYSGEEPPHHALEDARLLAKLCEQARSAERVVSGSTPILIIDLENTCMPEAERPADYHGQIIEIGAAWVTPSGEVLGTFEAFVQAEKPVTEFCTELLGITQADVDGGLPFPAAMQALAEFATRYAERTWASWGAADLNSLNHDCAHHGLESPLANWSHRNLKKEWAKARKTKRVGMKKALEIAGIPLEGPHHRALADVLNIARLYADEACWATLQALPVADEDFLVERPSIFDVPGR